MDEVVTVRPPRWLRSAISRIEANKRLDPVGIVLTNVAKPLLDCRSLASLLRGDFMGHALHPLLTDVPIGAWLSAALLDAAGGEESRQAATRLTAVGLIAVGPTVPAVLWNCHQLAPSKGEWARHTRSSTPWPPAATSFRTFSVDTDSTDVASPPVSPPRRCWAWAAIWAGI
jgi:hypothetical protein